MIDRIPTINRMVKSGMDTGGGIRSWPAVTLYNSVPDISTTHPSYVHGGVAATSEPSLCIYGGDRVGAPQR
jgi:hypothetical protein